MTGTSFTAAGGQQQFLQLLVTQLQHQDPFQPLEQTEFIAQLAQFSSLEGIERLNSGFSQLLALQQLSAGGDLVGRTVTFHDDTTDTAQTGIVSAVRVGPDGLLLNVGSQEVPLQQILTVGSVPEP